jgi:DNA repair protein RecO (recombination protein O)
MRCGGQICKREGAGGEEFSARCTEIILCGSARNDCAAARAVISNLVSLRACSAHCDVPRTRGEALMPVRESEAIVLQTYALGEADRIVSLLTRSMGRLRGVAAGARRPKSRFGGTLEPMSHVRVWFYEKETRELVRVSQCELLESFLSVFRDYNSGVAFSLMIEITESILPDREPSDAAFRLLLVAARAIKQSGKVALPLAYFALWSVRLAGWLPSMQRCAHCGEPLADGPAYSSHMRPALVCAKCRLPGMQLLAGSARSAGSRLLAARLDDLLPQNFTEPPLKDLTEYMLDIIEHQVERKLQSRAMLASPV